MTPLEISAAVNTPGAFCGKRDVPELTQAALQKQYGYVNLLMGEIPRLTDDENGYGPCGKNFIAHVDVPEEVRCAFEQLKTVYGLETRAANPAFA